MDLVLVGLLAFTLGAVLGAMAMAFRAARLAEARRAVAGSAAGLARFSLGTMPTRSASDVLAGRVRIVLGGQVFVLPVLSRRASREWLETLDARMAFLGDALEAAGDDTPKILALLASQADGLIDMLRAYDVTGVLPDPEYVEDRASNAEILVATLEVWRAEHPLAASLVEAAAEMTDGTESEPPSSSPAPTGGTLASLMTD